MLHAGEDEARTENRGDDSTEGVKGLRGVEASCRAAAGAEHGDVGIGGDLEDTLAARHHEERQQEERVPACRGRGLEEQCSQRTEREANKNSSAIAQPPHQPSGWKRHQEVATEERRLNQRRLEVAQVERLLEVGNQDVVEVDADRPEEEERRDQDERHEIPAFGKRRTTIGHRNSGQQEDAEGSGQGAIEVDVAAINIEVLAGDVSCAWREEEARHRRDLLGQRHPVSQGDVREDFGLFGGGIGEAVEPLPVERRHHFGRDDGVDANAAGQQLDGPLTGEREDGTLGRGVAGGVALAGNGGLAGDVEDRAVRAS